MCWVPAPPCAALKLAIDTATRRCPAVSASFYVNTVSWRNDNDTEYSPDPPARRVQRLFGDGGSATERTMRTRKTANVLDLVRAEADRLAGSSATAIAASSTSISIPCAVSSSVWCGGSRHRRRTGFTGRPISIPASFDDCTKLMLNRHLLAFRPDTTRIFSMVLAREVSNRPYPHIGVRPRHAAFAPTRNDAA